MMHQHCVKSSIVHSIILSCLTNSDEIPNEFRTQLQKSLSYSARSIECLYKSAFQNRPRKTTNREVGNIRTWYIRTTFEIFGQFSSLQQDLRGQSRGHQTPYQTKLMIIGPYELSRELTKSLLRITQTGENSDQKVKKK